MSTNVRFISYEDFFKRSWFYRADLILDDIDSVQPDIIGFQEATFVHYDYLKKVMVGYDSEMAYRDEFVLSEGCPIFWRTDRFEKIDSGSFWLSETPEVMSKDWGSEHYRICVYVILRDLDSGEEFAVFNTHLDHTSDLARINGIKVVLDKISEFGNIPAYLMGDLNAKEDSETILSTKEAFDDAKLIAEKTDDSPTFHGWGEAADPRRIDYIMISKGDAEVYEYGVVNNLHGDVYSSDHSSIYIKTKLK
jgi:endonuclease/exonuclease/phosphatase family metal-dependent hydrolase